MKQSPRAPSPSGTSRWATRSPRTRSLFEVSTDKVDSEVPSPVSGTVTEILVQEGETVSVGTKLAVIGRSRRRRLAGPPRWRHPLTRRPTEARACRGAGRQPRWPGHRQTPGSERRPPRHGRPGCRPQVAAPSPRRRPGRPGRPACGPAPAQRSRAGRPEQAPVASGAPADSRARPGPGADRRDRAQGAGSPATTCWRPSSARAPTGPGRRARRGGGPGSPSWAGLGWRRGTAPAGQRPAASPLATASPAVPAPQAGERDTVVPFTNIRRRTAEHMVRSKHTSAHTMVAVEVDYSAVDRVRPSREGALQGRPRVQPDLPALHRPGGRRRPGGMALPQFLGRRGRADRPQARSTSASPSTSTSRACSCRSSTAPRRSAWWPSPVRSPSLASRARSKRLTMDDISGGTFTLTNAGGYGTFITVPVINQPQVAHPVDRRGAQAAGRGRAAGR